jgi:hypothetical protein
MTDYEELPGLALDRSDESIQYTPSEIVISMRPGTLHFYISAENAKTDTTSLQMVEGTSPEDALQQFLPSLLSGWEGSVSVDDDLSLHPSEMPLVEVWYGPKRIETPLNTEGRAQSDQEQAKEKR